MRPSTAPPSISAFSLSMARWLAAMVTSPARRSGRVLRRLTSLRPWSQATSVSGSEDSTLRRPLKLSAPGVAPLSENCVVPGARSSSRWKVQDRAVGLQLGRDVLERTAAQHDLVGVELDLRRDRRLRDRGKARAQRRQDALRLGIVLGRQLVGIDLARRQHRAQQRRGAEPEIADAAELQRGVFGAEARIDLLELGAGRIGLEFCGELPGRRPCLAGLLRPAARRASARRRISAGGCRRRARLRDRPASRARRDRC